MYNDTLLVEKIRLRAVIHCAELRLRAVNHCAEFSMRTTLIQKCSLRNFARHIRYGNCMYGAAKSSGLEQFPFSKFFHQNNICMSPVPTFQDAETPSHSGFHPPHLLYNRRGLTRNNSEFRRPEMWAPKWAPSTEL
jgi:hypothetical protein